MGKKFIYDTNKKFFFRSKFTQKGEIRKKSDYFDELCTKDTSHFGKFMIFKSILYKI